jgi:cation/acetate symporter
MPNTYRTHLVNPRLGAYFGIFASAVVAQFLLLLILERLGTSDAMLRLAVLFGPPALFVAIGVLSATGSGIEFFAAGRRVPAVCSGLVMAVTAIGSTGLLAWTGAFYVNGFDAWCLASGAVTGFVIMGVAIAPYVRKSGAYTVPTFLARRFQSRLLRITAASVFVVPMLLILTAELSMTLWTARLLVGLRPEVLALGAAVVILATVGFGGMRGMGWVCTAEAITVIIAVVTLAAMIGVVATNFPVSQLSYGPVLRAIGKLEGAQQIPITQTSALAFALAGNGLEAVTTRFASPYGTVGPISFAFANLTVAAGIAAGPWLLPRNGTTVGVYDARKSLGWAVFFFGLIAITLSALAVFMRDFAMQDMVGRSPSDLPQWFNTLRDLGLASVKSSEQALSISSFAIRRDAVLFALPLASGFPAIVLYLVLSGVIAAGLAAAAATTYAIATLLSEDVICGLRWDPPSDTMRVGFARIMTVVVVLTGLAFVTVVKTDPLRLFFWAVGLTGASAFPVVFLSVWWKRLTPFGAFASILTGFGVAVAATLGAQVGVLGLAPELAAGLGIVPALAMAIVISKLSVIPGRNVLEQVREMRIPGGETIYDRELRLLRQRQNSRRG